MTVRDIGRVLTNNFRVKAFSFILSAAICFYVLNLAGRHGGQDTETVAIRVIRNIPVSVVGAPQEQSAARPRTVNAYVVAEQGCPPLRARQFRAYVLPGQVPGSPVPVRVDAPVGVTVLGTSPGSVHIEGGTP